MNEWIQMLMVAGPSTASVMALVYLCARLALANKEKMPAFKSVMASILLVTGTLCLLGALGAAGYGTTACMFANSEAQPINNEHLAGWIATLFGGATAQYCAAAIAKYVG